MGLFSKSKTKSTGINWISLTNIDSLEEIKQQSFEKPILLFKHSTRCSISSSALNRIDRKWEETTSEHITPYYLDLISHRDISNQIAETFGVPHQSPQALIIKNGKCIYDRSHLDIQYDDIKAQISH